MGACAGRRFAFPCCPTNRLAAASNKMGLLNAFFLLLISKYLVRIPTNAKSPLSRMCGSRGVYRLGHEDNLLRLSLPALFGCFSSPLSFLCTLWGMKSPANFPHRLSWFSAEPGGSSAAPPHHPLCLSKTEDNASNETHTASGVLVRYTQTLSRSQPGLCEPKAVVYNVGWLLPDTSC